MMLKQYLRARGLTLRDMHAMTGIAVSTLSDATLGKSRLPIDRMIRIEDATDGMVPVQSWADVWREHHGPLADRGSTPGATGNGEVFQRRPEPEAPP